MVYPNTLYIKEVYIIIRMIIFHVQQSSSRFLKKLKLVLRDVFANGMNGTPLGKIPLLLCRIVCERVCVCVRAFISAPSAVNNCITPFRRRLLGPRFLNRRPRDERNSEY